MRLPKRGFKNIFRLDYNVINVGKIQEAIDAGKIDAKATVDVAVLVAAGVIRRKKDGLRLMAAGELTAKVDFVVDGASEAAKAAVEKAGGSVKVIERKVPVSKKAATK
jgi:large subunit ribosomal protein L15